MSEKQYDLEDRTAKFGEQVIDFCKTINQNAITRPLISQLVRASTSIGANYLEANGAISRKDFTHKIFICKKEAQETRHWLRMLMRFSQNLEIDRLIKESKELSMIFQKISSSLKENELKN